ncbi:aldose 1-epimerase [Nocardioides thalensis]|uniref:Aldose 1-epimerase n=1 Tax=Nocardioides thalensis TaxID=1914755 RepID=A0A853C859_9ACTN|nr:aldose 1-epimerase [Nocardioides thalensis]
MTDDLAARAAIVELGSAPGPVLHLLTLGATMQRLEVACGDGRRRDVLVGLPGARELLGSSDYLGGTIGRYANRIAHGRFELDGEEVSVRTNDRGHSLHAGPDGFDRRLWDVADKDESSATLRLVSPDGDQGFPGEVTAHARFTVEADRVTLDLGATTTRPTVVNMTSHAYFNLDGAGTVDDHLLQVPASSYTPVDEGSIPLGDHAPVDGTPFDLRVARPVGEVVREPHEQVVAARGIDHNLVVDGSGLRRVARLESPRSRTAMEVWSDQPGLQVYTGNFLSGAVLGRSGRLLRPADGIALEPQLHPDSPNHPEWPSATLRPGEAYRARIEWRFSATV